MTPGGKLNSVRRNTTEFFVPMSQSADQQNPETSVDEEMDFEAALTELEAVVDTMESGELKLEESLSAFQKGIALARLCQTRLDQAEQTVEALADVEDPDSGEPLPEMD